MNKKNDQIKSDIIERLALLDLKRYSNIHIAVDNGWVIITGSVEEKTQRDIVDKVASNVLGVQTVINKIAIVPTQDELDKSIAHEVVEAIDKQEEVNVEQIIVEVKHQTITLDGTVPTWRLKAKVYKTAHLIKHARKINTINNELRVTHA